MHGLIWNFLKPNYVFVMLLRKEMNIERRLGELSVPGLQSIRGPASLLHSLLSIKLIWHAAVISFEREIRTGHLKE
jgi:hypothetical protein